MSRVTLADVAVHAVPYWAGVLAGYLIARPDVAGRVLGKVVGALRGFRDWR